MMLYDLTKVSGQRVSQVDELHVGGRQWMRSADLFLLLGGGAAGAGAAQLLRVVFRGQYWPYLLVPVFAVAVFLLFTRKRSRAGETTRRRWDRWRDRHRAKHHEFILPGSPDSFRPNGRTIILLHSHPYDPHA
ncbi:hypothetical protein [Bifidobacterium castoris]|uniref:Uncharacterized protein n=1 Tax=Bifidobacterium castoris TaxID=2306972 RepID=A0A430FAL3_9BIFI|nr:hypothetical protein [Bifidobacterium castoris]RSX49859.1 hypothetical protein D2E22_0320 [Bifidobacterium castoris]